MIARAGRIAAAMARQSHTFSVMWVEAILSRDDLATLLAQCTPVTIHIGKEGTLTIEEIRDVSLVAGAGMRVVCSATVRWPVLGASIPAAIRSLVAVVRPEIEKRDGHDALAFRLMVEETDLTALPTILDESIAAKVNNELAKTDLVWSFSDTLSHAFRLPKTLEPLDALDLGVSWGQVRVTSEAVVFAVSFHSSVTRHDGADRGAGAGAGERAIVGGARALDKRIAPPRPRTFHFADRGALLRSLVVTALAAFALSGAFAVGRSTGHRAGLLRWAS